MLNTFRFWALLCALTLGLASTATARQPNVIIIYTDDQGTVDAGCYGTKDIQTPNIDRLSTTGVRFSQFYAPAPVCSPSRAGLLTGKYPVRSGVPGNVSSTMGHPGLPTAQTTIAEVFSGAGYATAHIGKWHLGTTPETMPNGQGFDHSFGHMGGCIDNYSHFFYWSGPNRHDLYRNGEEIFADGEFFPDLMVKEAGQFIEKNKDKPFFMYYAMNVPHYPYQGDTKWLQHYNDAGVPYPRNLYNAFVSTLDERLGMLLDKLEALGLRDDTIVVFQSDHGHSHEERAHHGGGSAGPYRGAKFSLFEGGIRVPAVISWPGHIPENEVRDQMGHGSDWFPTLAEYCDIDTRDLALDGRSITQVIQDAQAKTPHEILLWEGGHAGSLRWAVRAGDWKLLGNPIDTSDKGELNEDDKLFLVNMTTHANEMENQAATHPEIVEQLHEHYKIWNKSVRDEQKLNRDQG